MTASRELPESTFLIMKEFLEDSHNNSMENLQKSNLSRNTPVLFRHKVIEFSLGGGFPKSKGQGVRVQVAHELQRRQTVSSIVS